MKRALLFILVLLVVAAAAGLYAVRTLDAPYRGYPGDEMFVEIPQGTGVNAIGQRLIDAGVVRSRLAFRFAAWRHAKGRTMKAGEYRFAEPLRPSEVVERLVTGAVHLRSITFREGLTVVEMGDVYASAGLGTKQAFVDAARQAALVHAIDPSARDLEGYLFPETYALPRSATADTLVTQMVRRFLDVYDEPLRARAAAQGMSHRDVVTLASLVEKEAQLAAERALVSAVYHNRLRIGMGLQADPTVIYALQKAGRWNGNLTRADLRMDSPYNTYRYRGLPPGPIASPGRASLAAAVQPAGVPYLYFVSRNDGSHVFSTTLAEHNRNVQEFQVKYFRRARSKEEGGGTKEEGGRRK